jgi:hypothetical protein
VLAQLPSAGLDRGQARDAGRSKARPSGRIDILRDDVEIRRSLGCRVLALTAALTAAPVTASRPGLEPMALADPIARPAVDAILRTFDTFPLVAIGESHRNQQIHDFIVKLVSDPRFASKVDDVVVEFASATHQDIVDRYTDGQPIPISSLRRALRDTVNILVWDAPVYERFFKTIRTVNQRRKDGRKIRVLAADPPFDWSRAGHDDWIKVAATRDEFAASLVEREVLAKRRRALLIFGATHVTRDSAFDAYGAAPDRRPTVAELLAARHPGSIFLIWSHVPGYMARTLDPQLVAWKKPSLAALSGTWVGRSTIGPPGQSPTLERLADGFLYLGPTWRMTTSTPAPQLYSDKEYLRELIRRDQIQGGIDAAELEPLRRKYLK